MQDTHLKCPDEVIPMNIYNTFCTEIRNKGLYQDAPPIWRYISFRPQNVQGALTRFIASILALRLSNFFHAQLS